MLSRFNAVAALLLVVATGSSHAGAAARSPDDSLIVGEVRSVAVNDSDPAVMRDLHRRGWLQAGGQTLWVTDFPELYAVIGRAWTSAKADAGKFAIPNLCAPSSGTLPGDDTVTGGRELHAPPKLSQWIYVGRDASVSGDVRDVCTVPTKRRR